jgi:hypothetical protein
VTHQGKEGNESGREIEVRVLDGLVANTMWCIKAVEGDVTAEEKSSILLAIKEAQRDRENGSIEVLRRHQTEIMRVVERALDRILPGRGTFGGDSRTGGVSWTCDFCGAPATFEDRTAPPFSHETVRSLQSV